MLALLPVDGLPEIRPGDDLPALLADKLRPGRDPALKDGDVLVVTQKIVSKAENRFVALADVRPSARATTLAQETNKEAALVELVLRESTDVVRAAPHVLITRHRLGHIMANAGIDASNIGQADAGKVLLLPKDPDSSAAAIRAHLAEHLGINVAVIISDSFGRPWRMGTINVAIGVAGMAALVDERGKVDRDGRELQMTQIAVADAIAAAAGLVMGEGNEGIPVTVVRGWADHGPAQTSVSLLRAQTEDLFR
ncbi:coenzyme F420-0:L-glutamate ligase [Sphingomonas psychrolutea]|uniref:F420-0--gamma-glutamyl ligase n=1 Tax=Sphingomonas psychrolutea TaxID=1259676 RepID=A0ABQ1G637_9SPHN|nr:coenzyme F420-0:L-glutamate ligase [Sphingomonas psychrolutea]GGA37488.1 F420-0--gamma-glutamyl ligase [Sphingomonas psychrolutea]